MRIIAGSAKGHRLKALKGLKTRPTLEKVREAVFNVLGTQIVDAIFLDLFAGTGAMGIEALSRGAAFCYFNDSARQAQEIIRQNLAHCRLEDKARLFSLEASQLLKHPPQELQQTVNIVYVDPPYLSNQEDILLQLAESPILADQAAVIVETDSRTVLTEATGKMGLTRKSIYGDTIIWYYRYKYVEV
ncbi:MAG: 16S rRNA (guanine(966)-N(2))-methyltransferase RsmD [Clostridia bacterium]|nr:16S rRNA (guanine(966)-N(2))-methyltransferase RsmD [Clostridia bacterium]